VSSWARLDAEAPWIESEVLIGSETFGVRPLADGGSTTWFNYRDVADVTEVITGDADARRVEVTLSLGRVLQLQVPNGTLESLLRGLAGSAPVTQSPPRYSRPEEAEAHIAVAAASRPEGPPAKSAFPTWLPLAGDPATTQPVDALWRGSLLSLAGMATVGLVLTALSIMFAADQLMILVLPTAIAGGCAAGWLVQRLSMSAGLGASAGAGALAVAAFDVVSQITYRFAYLIFYQEFLSPPLGRLLVLTVFQSAIAAGLGLLGGLAGRPRRTSRVTDEVVRGVPSDLCDSLALALSGLPNQMLSRPSANSVSVVLRSTPGWQVVVSVLFFPLGLIALAAGKREDLGTIIVTHRGDGWSDIRTQGIFHPSAQAAVDRVVRERLASVT
jgi:hypothetical protein